MKTFVKTFAIAIAILTSATIAVHAEDKETKKASSFATGMYVTKQGKVNILVDKNGQEYPTTLLLKNANGQVLYTETISKKITKFGKQLVLDGLNPGSYQIEIVSRGEKQTKNLQVLESVEREISIK